MMIAKLTAPHRPGDSHLRTEDGGGQDDGQDVDGRAGIEKGTCRTEPRPHAVDAGEEGQDGAGADRQDRPGDRGDPVGERLVGLGPEVLHHRRLADENPHRPGNEEGRHQAEQHMLLRVPLDQVQRFPEGVFHPPARLQPVDRQPVAGREDGEDRSERFPFLFPVHSDILGLTMAFWRNSQGLAQKKWPRKPNSYPQISQIEPNQNPVF
jgi:hypothetical protein